MNRRTLLRRGAGWMGGAAVVAGVPRGLWGEDAGVSWMGTTEAASWQTRPLREPGWRWDTLDVTVRPEAVVGPPMAGFGACFSEQGWTSLSGLGEGDREGILREMFAPGVGANFSVCRMPIGANDYARGWYSYDETPGDYGLEHFSIANDRETLVPFIEAAMRQNPELELWASPWSPPSWMKRNKHYAAALQRPGLEANGLTAAGVSTEGTDLMMLDDKTLATYAAYFGRFVDAYRALGIRIGMVMPQNEFNSAQPFPSCTWTPEGLAKFLRYLGPEMSRREVEIFFGTLERGNEALLTKVMADPDAGRYVKGVGVQWAGKAAVAGIRRDYPGLRIYQSEQECGDGKNDWAYAGYTWELMKHYLRNGASGYMYWNLATAKGGVSHWGWPQNSLVSVDAEAKSFTYNHEYYVLKHASHFVQRGARRLETEGTCDDVLAYGNPDGSVVVMLRNEAPREKAVNVMVGDRVVLGTMAADSMNTVVVRRGV